MEWIAQNVCFPEIAKDHHWDRLGEDLNWKEGNAASHLKLWWEEVLNDADYLVQHAQTSDAVHAYFKRLVDHTSYMYCLRYNSKHTKHKQLLNW